MGRGISELVIFGVSSATREDDEVLFARARLPRRFIRLKRRLQGKTNAVGRAVTGKDHPDGTFDGDGDLSGGARMLPFRLGDGNDFRWFAQPHARLIYRTGIQSFSHEFPVLRELG